MISPILPCSCRFYPSCSQYAIEAVDVHGIGAFFKIIWRILRCNPFSKGGYDPVPEYGKGIGAGIGIGRQRIGRGKREEENSKSFFYLSSSLPTP